MAIKTVIALRIHQLSNRESTAQFENQINPWVYVRRITRSSIYVRKSSISLAGTGVRKISSVASGSSPIKIHYFDYLKRFINRINEVYDFSIIEKT